LSFAHGLRRSDKEERGPAGTESRPPFPPSR